MDVMPRSNLPEPSQPWGRRHDADHVRYDNELERSEQANLNNNKQLNGQINVLNEQVVTLSATVDSLSDANAKLLSYAQIQYTEFTSAVVAGGVGFVAPVGPINITSLSGRLELNYGGSLNSGEGYFCYQITNTITGALIVSRNTVQVNPAKRVAVTGGASFAPSGYRSAVVTVPANVGLSITLEMYSGLAGTTFLGGSIQAKVAP